MARGILDSLMSATYFNASALRLLRQLVNIIMINIIIVVIMIILLSHSLSFSYPSIDVFDNHFHSDFDVHKKFHFGYLHK